MSPTDEFRSAPDPEEAPPVPWWGTLVVALVLTIAAVSAGLLAGGIA